MKTTLTHVTLDLSRHGGCSVQQSALLCDLTRDATVSAILESFGADCLEIRFTPCDSEDVAWT